MKTGRVLELRKRVTRPYLTLVVLLFLAGCNQHPQTVGTWIHGDKAIVMEMFQTGDVRLNSPCYPEIPSNSGQFEFLDAENLKLTFGNQSDIYKFKETESGFSLSSSSQDSLLMGEYFSDSTYDQRMEKYRQFKADYKYWYTERKVGDEYEFVGVPDDAGWRKSRLTAGAMDGRFQGCDGGFPLLDGVPIFDDKSEFNSATVTRTLQSNTDPSLYFLQRLDLDRGALEFRVVFDASDNVESLSRQAAFFKKRENQCLYTYGTPIFHEAKKSIKLFVPVRCGSSQSSFILMTIFKNEGKPIHTSIKLVELPHFGAYWRTDCSPSVYFTDVGDRSVNLRLVLTDDYGQSYNSKADGNCGSPGRPEFVEDVEFDLP